MLKKKIIKLSVFACFVSAAVFFFLIKAKIPSPMLSFIDIGTYRAPADYFEVNKENIIGQTFVCNFDYLFMMSVFIPVQDLEKDMELIFHLKGSPCDTRDLVSLKWKYNQIGFAKNSFYTIPPDRESTKAGFHFHFQFPALKDARGKEFYLYFESPAANPQEGVRLGLWKDIPTFEGLTKGTLFINGRAVPGFLAFRTYNTWRGNLFTLAREIKFNLLRDKPFFIFYSLLLGLVLFLIFSTSVFIRKEMI